MSDTLEQSLRSVLNQIDCKYEVLVVDDGSNDGSQEVLKELQSEYPFLRILFLERNSTRKLGLTRNISIREARGEWCIFHIDTDDYIGPHISEFMDGVEALHGASGGVDKLYAGQQIHAARRDFLLAYGPFDNLYRGEDRDLYMRLFKNNQWLIIDHQRFIERIPRAFQKNLRKVLWDLIDQMSTDLLREDFKIFRILETTFKRTQRKPLERCARLVLIPAACLHAISRRDRPNPETRLQNAEFVRYREAHRKTLSLHLKDYGMDLEIGTDSIFFDGEH
jgi:glycosyltransferase involved in cell wall biosynthesis